MQHYQFNINNFIRDMTFTLFALYEYTSNNDSKLVPNSDIHLLDHEIQFNSTWHILNKEFNTIIEPCRYYNGMVYKAVNLFLDHVADLYTENIQDIKFISPYTNKQYKLTDYFEKDEGSNNHAE